MFLQEIDGFVSAHCGHIDAIRLPDAEPSDNLMISCCEKNGALRAGWEMVSESRVAKEQVGIVGVIDN